MTWTQLDPWVFRLRLAPLGKNVGLAKSNPHVGSDPAVHPEAGKVPYGWWSQVSASLGFCRTQRYSFPRYNLMMCSV